MPPHDGRSACAVTYKPHHVGWPHAIATLHCTRHLKWAMCELDLYKVFMFKNTERGRAALKIHG